MQADPGEARIVGTGHLGRRRRILKDQIEARVTVEQLFCLVPIEKTGGSEPQQSARFLWLPTRLICAAAPCPAWDGDRRLSAGMFWSARRLLVRWPRSPEGSTRASRLFPAPDAWRPTARHDRLKRPPASAMLRVLVFGLSNRPCGERGAPLRAETVIHAERVEARAVNRADPWLLAPRRARSGPKPTQVAAQLAI